MSTTSIAYIGLVCLLGVCLPAGAQNDGAAKPAPVRAETRRKLPPCPPGVTHVAWNEFFKSPVGDTGLELTDTIQQLSGKKVRLMGYMVRREEPVEGVLLLAPMPISIEEHEAGFADLPPQTVRVILPYAKGKQIPYTPSPLLLTGTLSVGRTEDAGEHVPGAASWFRLTLDMPLKKVTAPVKKRPATPPVKKRLPAAPTP